MDKVYILYKEVEGGQESFLTPYKVFSNKEKAEQFAEKEMEIGRIYNKINSKAYNYYYKLPKQERDGLKRDEIISKYIKDNFSEDLQKYNLTPESFLEENKYKYISMIYNNYTIGEFELE